MRAQCAGAESASAEADGRAPYCACAGPAAGGSAFGGFLKSSKSSLRTWPGLAAFTRARFGAVVSES